VRPCSLRRTSGRHARHVPHPVGGRSARTTAFKYPPFLHAFLSVPIRNISCVNGGPRVFRSGSNRATCIEFEGCK
jgi:hypothetical protein